MKGYVTLYGAKDSDDTDRTQRVLESLAVGYHYVNIELDPMGREEVLELNQGQERVPVVVIEGKGTRILSKPSDSELMSALAETQVRGYAL